MKSNSISIRNLDNSSLRIDPSFHLSEAIVLRKELDRVPYEKVSIKEASEKVFLGNIFSRIFVKDAEHGVPYLAASDTVLADINTGRFLSKKQANSLSYLVLKKDWILITCSGTIGNITYTNSTFENHIATHDLIRIIPNNNKVLKGYLYAFLSSKYGYNLLTQSRFGGVVKHINAAHVEDIELPNFPESFQQQVDNLIQESARLREEATHELEDAKNKILNYCKTPFVKSYGFTMKHSSVSEIRNSFNMRLDPTVYINDGVQWIDKQHFKTKRLGDCNIKIWYPGMFKRVYVQNGLPYIKGSSLFELNPFRSCEHLSRTKTPKLDELWLKEGMILISCAGACGLVKMITREYNDKQAIGSPDIIRILASDSLFTKEYLFAYLQLPQIYEYMQSLKYGSVIERFDSYNIENLPIIEPTTELSNAITSIIGKYMELTYQAFTLEEKAISMVEEEIEKWNN